MEEEEEESSRTKPPFWIQTNSNSNTNTITNTRPHPRSNNKLNLFSAFFLLLLFISSLLILTFLLLLYPPNIATALNLNHLFFKKGWDSINITLLLLAFIFGFFSQNHHRHASHIVTDGDDRSAYAGPSNPPTVGFDGKHEDDSVVRGWFEYSDRPSGPNTFVDGDDRWIGFSNTNIYPEQFDRIHVMVDNEVHKSNESISQADETSQEVVIKSLDNTGIVLEVRGKFVCVRGLDGVTEGEVVEFDDDGTIGIVVTNRVSNDNVGVTLLSEGTSIRQGSFVKATGKIAQVPENVGRVVDVLGGNIDGRCENNDSEIKEVTPAVRRRKRRTAESIANNGRSSEETSGVEQKGGKISHRRTKSSGLELPSEKSSHRKTKSSCFECFGTVLLVGNGVARIYGLDEVTDGEVVEFEDGTIGIVTNSESANNVGVVLMGDGLLIQEGSLVKATGKVAEIPVSEAPLGSVINALAKPIDDKGKNYGSESLVSEERETKRMPPAVRRRNRRTAGSIQEKGKLTEETNGSEIEAKLIHRKTKRTHEESVTAPPKVETSDVIEAILYVSSPEKLVQDGPQSERNERKSATREFLTSLTKRKKKQRQKSVDSFDDYDTMPESPPPPSKGFFSSKKGKGKKVIEVPLPPLPPPPLYAASREQKSVPTTDSAAARRPPLPVKVQNFTESSFTGAESPLHPVPSPPPPPPFKMSSWKFVVKGDYVNIGSVNSSRSVSPEREEVESHMSSESVGGGDVAMGSMFCPSPDVNSKADVFIAKFREGLKLQKTNSMKMKQRGVGLSNLGSVSSNDQAQAN